MDTKKTIIGMGLVLAISMGYWLFLQHVYKNHPEWDYNGTLNQTPPAATSSNSGQAALVSTNPSTTTEASIGPATSSSLVVSSTQPGGPPALVGSDTPGDSDYALGVEVNPQAAAVGSVTINA